LHAEFVRVDEFLLLRDLGSTNGTYVNGTRITEADIAEGDLILFANVAFRVGCQKAECIRQTVRDDVCDEVLALVQFEELIDGHQITPFFQPIVKVDTMEVIGYEALARSNVAGMREPKFLFQVASRLGLEVELSRVCRRVAILATASCSVPPHLFLNTHPAELAREDFVESILAIREMSPKQPITLEIHEAAVTDLAFLKEARVALNDLDIGLAFDDFGAGQTRLVELVEVQPDYLKFDAVLVRDIDQASTRRQQMVATLVGMVNSLGAVPLAECIEREGEHKMCQRLGFRLAQGFHYGRPSPLSSTDGILP